jgi:hypothetical protein
MPIDSYTPCPGGTGKKIKFCCPDSLNELEKIDRMLEGEQYQACLQFVEQLDQKRPGRACLLAAKSLLLRVLGQMDAAAATVATFLEKHPGNPIALAESAIMTATGDDVVKAMAVLQQAIVACDGEISDRLYYAMGAVAELLLRQGHFRAGRALFSLMAAIDRKASWPVETIVRLNRSRSVPLLVRDDRALDGCPADAPWRPRFEEGRNAASQGRWAEAAQKLAALAVEVTDAPAIWQNLAVIRGWLADTPGCVDALRKFASMDVPFEDAVEAEALAMCLVENPLDDARDICHLVYVVEDVEQLQAALRLARRVVVSDADPQQFAEEGQPSPKAVYLLLDRPVPSSDQDLIGETVPDVLGTAVLYGRQTDREARLEVWDLVDSDVEAVVTFMADFAGHGLRPNPDRQVDDTVSASWELLAPRSWFPEDMAVDRRREFAAERRIATVLARWPKVAMGIFDGRCPEQAAGEPGSAVKLAAAVLLLELWSQRVGSTLDLNPLRSRLGLPVPGPIDPEQTPVQRLPLVRLARVEAGKLSDEALVHSFRRATAFGADDAMANFAREIIGRPSLAGRDERLLAYSTLAHAERDTEQGLAYVEQGRQAAIAANQSSASWDLLELAFRFRRAEVEEASRLLRHIEREHFNEPGVAETLTDLLVQAGLIAPDGTPVAPMGEPAAVGAAAESPAPEPGKLWTPDSQKPAEEKKLWMPGMD